MRQTIPFVPAVSRYALHPALFLACAALALLANAASAAAGEDLLKALTPVTNELLAKTAPQDWLMRRGNYRAWGYSALDQINAQNVGRLRLAWAWNMEPGYQEEAPLAHDGVVFLANPKNVVQALDGRTGDLLWEYRRELPKIEGGYHNDLLDRARGTIALYADKVVLATADAHIVALDARTGKVIWDTAVADHRQGYNPVSKTLVVPLNNLCMDYKAVEQQELPGEDYGRGRMVFRHAPDNHGNIGRVEAVSLETKQTEWKQQRRPYWSSSLLATAGGLVFGGDTNRRIAAFDATSGNALRELPLNSQPGGFPMTYMAGGKQYVAIPTGLSLIGNRVVRQLTPEIPVPSRGSTLMVFALAD